MPLCALQLSTKRLQGGNDHSGCFMPEFGKPWEEQVRDLTGSEQREKWSVNPDWHELHTASY